MPSRVVATLLFLRRTDTAQPEPALVRLVQELDNAQRPM
jgi:hypothetical protein